MTYIKLVFFLIMVMMDRCGIITPISRRNIIEIDTVRTDSKIPNTLHGSWRLDHAETGNISENRLPDSMSKNEDKLLSFFPDSTFSEVNANGYYATGKWAYSDADSSLKMVYSTKSEQYKVFFNRAGNGLREVELASVSGKNLSLSGFGKCMEKFRDDPFYPANNIWRKKPAQPENEKQIRDRLLRYISHNARLLNAAYIRKQQILSWEFSKGIIKIYNGGIGLVGREEIPQVWINSFYSKEDALTAYEMMDNYLRTTSYKGKATGNWVKDDYLILVSIFEGLKRTA